MPPPKKALPSIRRAVDNYRNKIDQNTESWLAEIAKMKEQAELFKAELLDDSDEGETISYTAQTMIEDSVKKIRVKAGEAERNSTLLHAPLSHIGKEIDRNMLKEIVGLVRNEKDLEGDAKSQRLVNGMICDYLMSAGFTDVAEILCNEANLGTRIDNYKKKKEECDEALKNLEDKSVEPAIALLDIGTTKPNEPLVLDLKLQHAKHLIENGEFELALEYCRKGNVGSHDDIAKLCGALVMKKAGFNNPRYEELFSTDNWEILKERTTSALTQFNSNLGQLMNAGFVAVLALIRLKEKFGGKRLDWFLSDEMPVQVDVAKPMHSVFLCPVMRTQSTDSNPPMKLSCGHVISQRAFHLLTHNAPVRHRSRVQTLKCPYCPIESIIEEAKFVILDE